MDRTRRRLQTKQVDSRIHRNPSVPQNPRVTLFLIPNPSAEPGWNPKQVLTNLPEADDFFVPESLNQMGVFPVNFTRSDQP